MPEIGERRMDPDRRVSSRVCIVVGVDDTHVTIQRGRVGLGPTTKIRLDRWARFPRIELGRADE